MGLPAALDGAVDHVLGAGCSLDDHRGTVELLGLIQRSALGHEEAEAAVRLAAHPEEGDVLAGGAAKIHDGADLAVGVDAHLCAGILAGQIAGGHAAVPEGDGALCLVHRDGVAEEAGAAGEVAADEHGERAVSIRLAAGGNAVGVEQREHAAHRGAELGEEIRPAAGAQSADVVLAHIALISLVQAGKVDDVVCGNGVQPHDGLAGLGQLLSQLLLGVALGLVDELPGLDGIQRGAEGAHHLGVQSAAKAEALGGVADGDHLQAAQVGLDLGGTDGSADLGLHLRLRGSAEDVLELALAAEGGDGVACGVGARQAVEAQAGAVDDRLPQGPQDDGAAKALEHLAGVGGIGEGDVLQHDEVGGERVEVSVQILDGQQHLLGHHAVRRQALEHGNGFFKLVLCAFQMEGADADGHIRYLKSHNRLLLLMTLFVFWQLVFCAYAFSIFACSAAIWASCCSFSLATRRLTRIMETSRTTVMMRMTAEMGRVRKML